MSQSKNKSIIEALVHTGAGLITSFLIQLLIYPLMEIDVNIKQNIMLTILFFVVSLVRGYVIRRIFNALKE